MANISKIKLPDGITYNIKDSSVIKNLVDGVATGSIRQIYADDNENFPLGQSAAAFGMGTKATGQYAFAEGIDTTASGVTSHAEGVSSIASGISSHAEGDTTIASGTNSHAGGLHTTAQRKSQTAIGEYNVLDTGGTDGTTRGDYAFIIGNGTSSARSNALAVKWTGDVEVAGNITISGTPTNSTNAATKGYVDDSVGAISVPTITLNGTTSTSPSFYAPTTAGTSGQVLTSNGSGAPVWAAASSGGPQNLVDGAATGSIRQIYAIDDTTNPLGQNAAAFGYNTKAIGPRSHAEGYSTIASGHNSHVEGTSTNATGTNSHAEGAGTEASGVNSHASGWYTTAQRKSQTTLGEYNILDTGGTDGTTRGNYAFIIGNGKSSSRSNAFTVAWDGVATASGKMVCADMSSTEIENFCDGLFNGTGLLSAETIALWNDILGE